MSRRIEDDFIGGRRGPRIDDDDWREDAREYVGVFGYDAPSADNWMFFWQSQPEEGYSQEDLERAVGLTSEVYKMLDTKKQQEMNFMWAEREETARYKIRREETEGAALWLSYGPQIIFPE